MANYEDLQWTKYCREQIFIRFGNELRLENGEVDKCILKERISNDIGQYAWLKHLKCSFCRTDGPFVGIVKDEVVARFGAAILNHGEINKAMLRAIIENSHVDRMWVAHLKHDRMASPLD